MFGPDPHVVRPNENIPSICYIKNAIMRPNIQAGNPCQVIRTHFDQELTNRLLEPRWWD